jgi:peptide/nickel transport system permease protein
VTRRSATVRWLALRLGSAILTLFGVSVLVFAVLHLIPGRWEDILLGFFSTPEQRAALAHQYGLDRPLPEQYVRWVAAALSGDFGVSLGTQVPVRDEFIRRAPVTAQLALMATAISLAIGLPVGVISALGASRRLGAGAGRLMGAVGLSLPDFVLGSILVFVFSTVAVGPVVGGFVPFAEDPILNLRAMILPALTLAVFGAALLIRTTREAVLSVLVEPYVLTAVARGQRPSTIAFRHVVRNAAIPVLTVVAYIFGGFLGGAVIVEQLFAIPGLGSYVLTAVQGRDYAVVQAGAIIAATIFVAINMLADVAYVLIDPRIAVARTEPR